MSAVIVTPTAQHDLATLIRTHSLPRSTIERTKRSLEPLSLFPLLGAPLQGRWARFRFILGPWRWMIVGYEYDEILDRVAIVAIQDGRSVRAATSAR